MKTVLTIAGSDCSGGAGIQADLKTIAAHGLYGMSAVTALTAQNTTKVFEVIPISPVFVGRQMDAVFTDILPDAVKIGMVVSEEIIEVIAKKLDFYKAFHVVLDPVMIASSGKKLLSESAIKSLKKQLFPLVELITPNLREAEKLSGITISVQEDMIQAAKLISQSYKGNVLIKGGHLEGCADDLLYCQGKVIWFKSERIGSKDRHGTGCTLSSSIACHLACGHTLSGSIGKAKEYIMGALKDELCLGQGSHPLNHCYKTLG